MAQPGETESLTKPNGSKYAQWIYDVRNPTRQGASHPGPDSREPTTNISRQEHVEASVFGEIEENTPNSGNSGEHQN